MGEQNGKSNISNGVKISVLDVGKTIPDKSPKKYQVNDPKKDDGKFFPFIWCTVNNGLIIRSVNFY